MLVKQLKMKLYSFHNLLEQQTFIILAESCRVPETTMKFNSPIKMFLVNIIVGQVYYF